MWPGQQPPGGEQNPQDAHQNPYQQPGYQQSGYQQAGYQPNPYQQPAAPQYAPPMPPGGNGKKTTVIAIVAATAVVVAAVITGVVVLGKNDEGGSTKAGDKETSSPPSDTPEEPSAPAENPRGGSVEGAEPTIPGWKVVTNPKYATRFDVPPEWEVKSPGQSISFTDDKDKPLISVSAPAYFKSGWCGTNAVLGAAGTRGANGASTTGPEAENVAGAWVFAGYDQEETGTFKISKATPFTSRSGLKGSVSVATVTGVKKKTKCDTDGKSIAFAFKNANGDFAVWSLFTSKGVKDELPDATIKQILGTVRLAD
ncbi:hypothetical protein J7E96_08280 [Streptomyces sp. ISL-96]|uniref:hypothetical protein n=1 Tax=Streptomyces sp. ISL-96 TaxID=2819191 RepID=UPI001BE7B0B0|nr:hypothetical protein [Streptomyces sp. ISL-96]MBT2488518.1 hypothetical protein [Streptomyces sp. ISL-96]